MPWAAPPQAGGGVAGAAGAVSGVEENVAVVTVWPAAGNVRASSSRLLRVLWVPGAG